MRQYTVLLEIKAKINKWDLIKIKSIFFFKEKKKGSRSGKEIQSEEMCQRESKSNNKFPSFIPEVPD